MKRRNTTNVLNRLATKWARKRRPVEFVYKGDINAFREATIEEAVFVYHFNLN